MNDLNLNTNENIFKTIKQNWFIIVFFGGMILTWGRFESELGDHTQRIDNIESKSAVVDVSLVEVKTQLAQIQVTLEFIKENIKR